jgi:hypothetical protein
MITRMFVGAHTKVVITVLSIETRESLILIANAVTHFALDVVKKLTDHVTAN